VSEFKASLDEVRNPADPGNASPIFYPGEKIEVQIKLEKQVLKTKKRACLSLACPAWAKPISCKTRGNTSLSGELTRAGSFEVELSATKHADLGDTTKLTFEVQAFPTVTLEPLNALQKVPDDDSRTRCGETELKLKLDAPAPLDGAEVYVVSDAIKEKRVKVRFSGAAEEPDGPVKVTFVDKGYDYPIKLESPKRCALPSNSTEVFRVHPTLPTAILEWEPGADESKTHTPDDPPKLRVKLNYPAHVAMKVHVESDVMLERKHQKGKHARRGERTVGVELSKGTGIGYLQMQLDPKADAGTFGVTLIHRHDDTFLPVEDEGKKTVRFDYSPEFALSFPEQWATPEKKDYVEEDEVVFKVALDRKTDVELDAGKLVLTQAGKATEKRLKFAANTQFLELDPITLAPDVKTSVKLLPSEGKPVRKGKASSKTLKVHKKNVVYFGKVTPKGPYHEGDLVTVEVKTRYTIAGDEAEVHVANVQPLDDASGVMEDPAPLEAKIGVDTNSTTLELRLGAKDPNLAATLTLELPPGAALRTAPAKDKKEPRFLELDLRSQRDVRFGDQKPHLSTNAELDTPPFYVGEEVCFPVELSQGLTADAEVGALKRKDKSAVQTPAFRFQVDQTLAWVPFKIEDLPAADKKLVGKKSKRYAEVEITCDERHAEQKLFSPTTSKDWKKTRHAIYEKLWVAARPKPIFHSPAFKAPKGGTGKTPGGEEAYSLKIGEDATLLVQLPEAARPPEDGLKFSLEWRRAKTPPNAEAKLEFEPEALVSEHTLTLDAWVKNGPYLEVPLRLDDKTAIRPRPAVGVVVQKPLPQPWDELFLRADGAATNKIPGGAKIRVRVKDKAELSFSNEDGWLTRKGESTVVGTLHPEDLVTFRLHAAGGAPALRPLTGGGHETAVLFSSTPAQSVVPLDSTGTELPFDPVHRGYWVPLTVDVTHWAGSDASFDARIDKRATAVSIGFRGADVKAPASTGTQTGPGGIKKYGTKATLQSDTPGVGTRGYAEDTKEFFAYTESGWEPSLAPAARHVFTVGDGSRTMEVGAGRTVQLTTFGQGTGIYTKPDSAVTPGQSIRFMFVLNDEAQAATLLPPDPTNPGADPEIDTPGELLGYLQSTAFGQKLLMPEERDANGRPIVDSASGKPKRIKQNENNKHLGTPVTQPDPNADPNTVPVPQVPFPARFEIRVPPLLSGATDPDASLETGDWYDPSLKTFSLGFTIPKKPLPAPGKDGTTDPVAYAGVHDGLITDNLKGKFTAGQKNEVQLKLGAQPLISFGAEQTNIEKAAVQPTAPPTGQNVDPATVEPGPQRPVYQAVAMAELNLLVELADVPPDGGLSFQLHSMAFPVDSALADKNKAKAKVTVDQRREAAKVRPNGTVVAPWAPHQYKEQLDAATLAAEHAARVHTFEITPEEFQEARDGVLTKPVPVFFKEAAPQHALTIVRTNAQHVPRTDGHIAFYWNVGTGVYKQWRRNTNGSGTWHPISDLAEGQAYKPKPGRGGRPPCLVTLRPKSGCRTDPALGDPLYVKIATSAVAFPPRETWWIHPNSWDPDESLWTEPQKEFRLETAFAAEDVIRLRVFRTPKGDAPKPHAELTVDERKPFYPAFPSVVGELPKETILLCGAALEHAFRWPFGVAHPKKKEFSVSSRAIARYPVAFKEGEEFSEPIAAKLRFPPDLRKAMGALKKKKQRGKVQKVRPQAAATSITLVRPVKRKSTSIGPTKLLAIGTTGADALQELSVVLGLTKSGTDWLLKETTTDSTGASVVTELMCIEIANGVPAVAAAVPPALPVDPLRGYQGVLLLGADGLTAWNTILEREKDKGLNFVPPAAVYLGDDDGELKKVKGAQVRLSARTPDATLHTAAVDGADPAPNATTAADIALEEWKLVGRELLLLAGPAGPYSVAAGSGSHEVELFDFRRVHFERGDVKKHSLTKHKGRKDTGKEHLIDEEFPLHVAILPAALEAFRLRVHSPLFGMETPTLYRDYQVPVEPGERRKEVSVRLYARPEDQDEHRIFLELPSYPLGMVLGRVDYRLKAKTEDTEKNRKKLLKKRSEKVVELKGLQLKLVVPKLGFAASPFVRDVSSKEKTLLARFRNLFTNSKIAGVFGEGETVELKLKMSRPARADCEYTIRSDAFANTSRSYTLTFPEGVTEVNTEVELASQAEGVRLDTPLAVTLAPAPGCVVCRIDPSAGNAEINVVIAGEPVVNLSIPEPEEVDPDAITIFDPAELPWIYPAGPYAKGDTAEVSVVLTAPVPGDEPARVDLVSKAFDRNYPVELPEGEQAAVVEVTFSRCKKAGFHEITLEPVSGCRKGHRAIRRVKLYPERSVYVPPRSAIAPGGPFVDGDNATVVARLRPPAPKDGAKVELKGPFSSTPLIEFAAGEYLKGVPVTFGGEDPNGQSVSLVPKLACNTGEHSGFDVRVYSPEVQVAVDPVQPVKEVQVNRDAFLLLTLDQPAPGQEPYDPSDPNKDRSAEACFTGVDVSCEAFVPKEFRVTFAPESTVAKRAVRLTDTAGTYPLELKNPSRCKLGTRHTLDVEVREAPTVRFAARWAELAPPPSLDPNVDDASPGQAGPPPVKNSNDEVVFKVGDAVNIYMESSEEPKGEEQVMLMSPAFGKDVLLVKIPRTKKVAGKKKKKPFCLRVVLKAGYEPGQDGLTPIHKQPIQLFPPSGWVVGGPETDGTSTQEEQDKAKGLVHLNVVTPGVVTQCPLSTRPPGSPPTRTPPAPPRPPAFRTPCNLDHLVVVQYHGGLADGPTQPGWKLKEERKQQKQLALDRQKNCYAGGQTGSKDLRTEQKLSKRTATEVATELVEAGRGPFHLVIDARAALDAGCKPDDVLLYTPGKPPVLEVIAGPRMTAQDLAAQAADAAATGGAFLNDPYFHSTHISLQLKRAKFCELEFEEIRKVPRMEQFRALQEALATGGFVAPSLPSKVAIRRHHPTVDVLQRRGISLPGVKFKPIQKALDAIYKRIPYIGKKQKWKHVYPPFPDLRLNAAADDDSVRSMLALAIGQEEQGDPTGTAPVKRGEDETTIDEDHATLATFSVFAPIPLYEVLQAPMLAAWNDLNTIQGVLPANLVASLPPQLQGTVLAQLGAQLLNDEQSAVTAVNGTVNTVNGAGQWVVGANQTLTDFTATLAPSERTDLATGGLKIATLVHMLSFPLMRPREYEVRIGTCGIHDGSQPNSSAPCANLGFVIKAYPSTEFSLRYEFKTSPDNAVLGASGTYFDEGKHTSGMPPVTTGCQAQVANPDFDPTQETSTDNQEFLPRNEHLTTIAINENAEETRIARPATGPTQRGDTLEEKTGDGDSTLPKSADGAELIAETELTKVERGMGWEAKVGWHGGTKPGAAPDWKPKKEPGERHTKSRIFHPWGPPESPFGVPNPDPQTPHGMVKEMIMGMFDQHKQEVQGLIPRTGGPGVPIGGGGGGGQDPLQPLANCMDSILQSIQRLTELVSSLQDFVPSYGWGVKFEVAFLQGQLCWYWGWKQHESRWVFPWFSFDMDLILIGLRFQVDFGARASCGLINFELMIYLRLSVDASLKGGFQADLDGMANVVRKLDARNQKPSLKDLGKAVLPEWVDTWISVLGKAEVGINIVLIHENVCHANACVKTGLEFRWRLCPGLSDRVGLEYEVYFLGVTAQFTFKLLGKACVNRVRRLIEGSPDGLPWRRGALPQAAARALWNARKSVKVGWNKLLYQRRRINAALDAWQQLQLGMVASSTRLDAEGKLRYPYTSVPPGWKFTGAKDDDDERDAWQHNKDLWDLQWEECKGAFPLESMAKAAHRKYGLLKRVRLEDALSKKVAKVERLIEEKLLPRLDRLEIASKKLLNLDKRIDEEEQLADEGDGVSPELLKECVAVERHDPDLNWKQTYVPRNQPVTDMNHQIKAIEYYAAHRVAW
jgi:hypothetical protein